MNEDKISTPVLIFHSGSHIKIVTSQGRQEAAAAVATMLRSLSADAMAQSHNAGW